MNLLLIKGMRGAKYFIVLFIISSLFYQILIFFNISSFVDLRFFLGPINYIVLGFYLSNKKFSLSTNENYYFIFDIIHNY